VTITQPDRPAGAAYPPGLPSRPVLITILGTLTAFGPLSIDMYLSGLPELASDLDVSASLAQLTLTACLLGIAVGQIIGGPISDARGRRGPLLAGLLVYIGASLVCAVAPSITVLIAARLLQGLAGAFGIVIAQAIVRDLHAGREAVRLFAALMLVNGVAPILAPVAGAALLTVAGWRAVFVVLAAFGAVLLAVVFRWLGETLPRDERRAGGLASTLRTFRELLADRVFLGCVLSGGLVFSSLFSYIAGSPFVLQDVYGVSPLVFGVIFGINGVGIMLGGRVSARLSEHHAPDRLFAAGLIASTTGGAVLLVSVLAGAGLAGVLPSLLIVTSSVGLIFPNAIALALRGHPNTAGAAGGLFGLAQFSFGALAAPLVGIAGDDTAVPMAVVIATVTSGALLVFRLLVVPAMRTTSAGAERH
jgi:DHA1 family bicyclomycin/chloramphenicol resistance-like MFS transporter